MNTIKLSFENREQWLGIRELLFPEPEDGFPSNRTYTLNGCTIVEIGNIPYDATYDEEGNEVEPAGLHDDYAVDILASCDLDVDLTDYLVEEKSKYYHNFK